LESQKVERDFTSDVIYKPIYKAEVEMDFTNIENRCKSQTFANIPRVQSDRVGFMLTPLEMETKSSIFKNLLESETESTDSEENEIGEKMVEMLERKDVL
jgi:hypothetical protein